MSQPCLASILHGALWDRPHRAQRPRPAHSSRFGTAAASEVWVAKTAAVIRAATAPGTRSCSGDAWGAFATVTTGNAAISVGEEAQCWHHALGLPAGAHVVRTSAHLSTGALAHWGQSCDSDQWAPVQGHAELHGEWNLTEDLLLW
jgi:hypothetical protein